MAKLSSQLKGIIVDAVLNTDLFNDEVEIFSFEADDGVKRYQAIGNSTFDPNVSVIFSLPTEGKNIYITVTDGDPTLVRRVFSTIEDIELQEGVKLGNVQLLQSPELSARDICGVIFLPVKTSNILKYLSDTILFENIEYRFLLVVFIGAQEHSIWKTQGHDALMEFFSVNKKDLISFGAKA